MGGTRTAHAMGSPGGLGEMCGWTLDAISRYALRLLQLESLLNEAAALPT